MEPDQQLRNLRDFLLVYNRMTDICFQRCTSNFNYRNLTMDEERCVDNCAGKLIRSNHRLMGTYVQLMPRMVQRRMEEMESKAAELAKAAAAAETAAPLDIAAATTEAPPAFTDPITSTTPPAVDGGVEVATVPLPVATSVPDVAPEAFGSVSKPGSDTPFELDASISKSTIMQEVNLSAATPLTPMTETINPPVLSNAENGPSYAAEFPQPSITGLASDRGSSASLFEPPKLATLSENVPVSSSSLSQSESLSGQQKTPEVAPVSDQ